MVETRGSKALGKRRAYEEPEDNTETTKKAKLPRISRPNAETFGADPTARQTLAKTTLPKDGKYWDRGLSQLQEVEKLLRELNIDERSVERVDHLLEHTLDSLFDVPLPVGTAQDQLYTARRIQSGNRAGVARFEGKGKKNNKQTCTLSLDGPNGGRVNRNFFEAHHVDLTSDAVHQQLAGLLECFCNAFSSLHPIPSNTGLHIEIVDMALARVDIQSRAIAAPP